MIDLRFNRKHTRLLLKGSAALKGYRLSVLRLNWLLDQDKMVGCICPRLFRSDIAFYVIRNGNEYRLVSLFDNFPSIYIIDDIEAFVEMIGLDELVSDASEDEIILAKNKIAELPPTGVLQIHMNKLYLYDIKVKL
jgi:hypothetical protein